MNLAQLLVRTARVFPQRPAVFHGERQVCDYNELATRAGRIAAFLKQRAGLREGERVAVFMRNCPEYLEVLYAIWWAGLVAVPVNNKLHARELMFILENSGARLLFLSDELAPAAEDWKFVSGAALPTVITVPSADYERMFASEVHAPLHRRPDDLAWLFYTSGTTGNPKGVMQSHRNLLTMTSCYFSDVDAAQAGDAVAYAAPMSHGAGMCNFAHMVVGARHVVPESGGFDPAELLQLSRIHPQLSMFAAPTMVKRLVDHVAACGEDPSGFKTIVYGGGPMYLEDIKLALSVMGDCFVQIYGQGESPMTITALSRHHITDRTHPEWESRLASVGVAQTLVEVRVTDEAGRSLGIGEVGEILVRGDTVMAGYWENPKATADTLRDGWLWTGDMGSFDEAGFLTLKDRSKDMIISGGSNIYPREVEEVLLRHPGVREVSVVGRKDAEWGEVVVAFVVGEGVSDAALDALCLANIARFKRPKEYRYVNELPKNNYGKVLKTALRKMLES